MADTTKQTRSRATNLNPEARAFGIITTALEELPAEVVHRVLDHAAKMYGFYVVTDLPVLVGDGQTGSQVPIERRFDGGAPVPEGIGE